eukprot:CAMPEP_0170441220 /NCGR_PEP_ID=MMETSP0117_2-20130122/46773_1 /TAXON_ID=400756 /ORGANISM="Durinskia baltica, Strain CSIRO CS-38" /LENGTH=50 /DNA_ID=CAMNT_0010701737 /DNA_START=57 /DNA_END=206 /DNA_ORIENTATION=-
MSIVGAANLSKACHMSGEAMISDDVSRIGRVRLWVPDMHQDMNGGPRVPA